MNARVAAIKNTVVHSESVGIRGVGEEVHSLQHLAGCRIVLDEGWPAFGVVLAVVSMYLPDCAIVPGNPVVPRPAGRLQYGDHEFRLPGLRIHPEISSQPVRYDPKLTLVP